MFGSFLSFGSLGDEWDILVTKVWEVQIIERFAVVASLVSIFILASRDLYELKPGLRSQYGKPDFRLDTAGADQLRKVLYRYCLALLVFAIATMTWFLLYALLPNPCNPITMKAMKTAAPPANQCGVISLVFHPTTGWILAHLSFSIILIVGMWMVLRLTTIRQATVGWNMDGLRR